MPLGVLLIILSEKLSAFSLRYGRHIVRSALPCRIAIAFSRQVSYPQLPQLSSCDGSLLFILRSISSIALLPGMVFCILINGSDFVISASSTVSNLPLPANSSTALLSCITPSCFLSIAGPPIQLLTQADISIKHFPTLPSIISRRALRQFSTPSIAI